MYLIASRGTWGKKWYGQYGSDRTVSDTPDHSLQHAVYCRLTELLCTAVTLFCAFASFVSLPLASFDETKRPKNKRVDTTKGRVSYPEITPLSNHHSAGYPGGSASGTAGAAGGLPPSHGPGDARGSISASSGRPPNRKDGYTKIDFSSKQPKPPPAAAAAAGQKPAQQRISYTPVEIRGKPSESNTVQSVAAPATANRINYTQVDLSAKSRPKSNTASAGSTKNAASRVSYHQVDISKTENYRRPSAEAAVSASVPPVRAFGEDEHSVHPSSSSVSVSVWHVSEYHIHFTVECKPSFRSEYRDKSTLLRDGLG